MVVAGVSLALAGELQAEVLTLGKEVSSGSSAAAGAVRHFMELFDVKNAGTR